MKIHSKGGVLLTTLLFVFLFSFLFNLILDNFQLTRKFDERTNKFYYAKSMVHMVVEDVKNQTLSLEKGSQIFMEGNIDYQRKANQLIFTVNIGTYTYVFEEEIVWLNEEQ